MVGQYLHYFMRRNGVVLNLLNAGASLLFFSQRRQVTIKYSKEDYNPERFNLYIN
jgi:hypothetical protein